MQIGFTERGDAGVDLSWQNKLNGLDGVVLITKNITNGMAKILLSGQIPCPVILHATCTGNGGTELEPNVPNYKMQLSSIKKLIAYGFPKKNIVLRIDPIFPDYRLDNSRAVIEEAYALGLLPDMRVRISVVDQYKHMAARFRQHNIPLPYPEGQFYASPAQFQAVQDMLTSYPNVTFETCAEYKLNGPNIVHTGCLSKIDLGIMGVQIPDNSAINGQNRNGCLCLACKKELLTQRHPCRHQCKYCFWKD